MSESLSNLERLLASQEITFGRQNLEIAKTLIKIARTAVEVRDYLKAEAAYWRALDIFRKVYGEQHVDVLFCIEQLADIAEAQSDDVQADRLRQQAAQIKENPMTNNALPPRSKPSVTQSFRPAPAAPPATPSATLPTVPLSQTQPLPTAQSFVRPCAHGYHPAECPLCIAVRNVAKEKAGSAAFVDVDQPITESPSLVIMVKTTGEKVALGTKSTWIGRDAMNDVALPNDAGVAPCHAVIDYAAGQYFIRACSDNDKVMLNGNELTCKRVLRSGDVIHIGNSHLQVQ